MKKLRKKKKNKNKNHSKFNWNNIDSFVNDSYKYNNFCNSKDVNEIALNVFGALSINASDLK